MLARPGASPWADQSRRTPLLLQRFTSWLKGHGPTDSVGGRGAQLLPPWPPWAPPDHSWNWQTLLGPGGQSSAMLPHAINSAPRPVTSAFRCVPLRSPPQAAPVTTAARPGSNRPHLSEARRGSQRQPRAPRAPLMA
ncbi:hypothetical protein NDU88_004072 [Pleurodeles waltl]|uniref:Uncharacterized protein n=1 Tax=Pleurodeles waltl TaxID=8319 RepID=A0AAV7WUA0_PLEWA|nr:hypothetical protein NDU88_004072 [Pleurodeles waltl]